VDFIDLYVTIYHWPTFNIADAFITIGASVLVIVELRSYFREIMKEKK
jgi:lipoprotein signal peptidase